MRFLRNKRLLAVGALGGLIALMLFVVLPAVASSPTDFVAGQSAQGVLPTDVAIGGTGDCANLFPRLSGPYSEYDNVNPKNATNLASGNNDGAKFSLALSGSSKQQVLGVTASGAEILSIGIKGGTQSTAYDYVNGPYVSGTYPNYTLSSGTGSVTQDSLLHAPAQDFTTANVTGLGVVESPSQYYAISQLTVCYTQGSVSGTVYQDSNFSGALDSGEPTLSGWTIHLYNSGGSLVGTATSNANGAYRIGSIFDGGKYTVCEVPNPATPLPAGDNAWAQTQPGAGSATCAGTGELKNGWSIMPGPLDNVTGQDFGNVGAIKCTSGPFGPSDYQVGVCKPTQTYVFTSGTTPGGKPYVSYFVGDPTQPSAPTVEKVTFPDPWSGGGPLYKQILFEDSAGFQVPTDSLPAMPYCGVDPRNTGALGYPESYTLQAPIPGNTLPAGATSCLISLKITAPAGVSPDGTMVAYVYSTTDSVRMGG